MMKVNLAMRSRAVRKKKKRAKTKRIKKLRKKKRNPKNQRCPLLIHCYNSTLIYLS